MKKRLKAVSIIAATVILFFTSISTAFAAEVGTVQVKGITIPVVIENFDKSNSDISYIYDYIKQIVVGLTIEKRTAYSYIQCSTYDSMNISITAKLQMKENGSWKTLETYIGSADDKECIISESRPVAQGYEYRLYVTCNAGGEKVTKIGGTEQCYSLPEK